MEGETDSTIRRKNGILIRILWLLNWALVVIFTIIKKYVRHKTNLQDTKQMPIMKI